MTVQAPALRTVMFSAEVSLIGTAYDRSIMFCMEMLTISSYQFEDYFDTLSLWTVTFKLISNFLILSLIGSTCVRSMIF